MQRISVLQVYGHQQRIIGSVAHLFQQTLEQSELTHLQITGLWISAQAENPI